MPLKPSLREQLEGELAHFQAFHDKDNRDENRVYMRKQIIDPFQAAIAATDSVVDKLGVSTLQRLGSADNSAAVTLRVRPHDNYEKQLILKVGVDGSTAQTHKDWLQAGVPVPQVVADGVDGVPYMLMEQVPGVRLADINFPVSKSMIHTWLRDVTKWLRRGHQVQPAEDTPSFVEEYDHSVRGLVEFLDFLRMDQSMKSKLIGWAATARDSGAATCSLHNDIGMTALMIEQPGGPLTGLIDVGGQPGPAYYDLARAINTIGMIPDSDGRNGFSEATAIVLNEYQGLSTQTLCTFVAVEAAMLSMYGYREAEQTSSKAARSQAVEMVNNRLTWANDLMTNGPETVLSL